jgi:DNA adenine methylase
MQKPRSYAEVYNDLDNEICNLFRVLRDDKLARALKRQLELTPFARKEWEQAYRPTSNRSERARRTVIRAYMGFGSASTNPKHSTGFRASSNRSGTTPAHDWANLPTHLLTMSERLKGVCIESRPALQIIETHDSEATLFYVDPPYVKSTRETRQRDVYKFELSDDDHRELAAALHAVKGMVVLSGYPSALYDVELFADWHRVERPALSDSAKRRTEVLWLNHKAATGIKQPGLFK